MRRFFLVALLFVLTGSLIVLNGSRWIHNVVLSAQRYWAVAPVFQLPPPQRGTEEQWLAEQIVRDVAEIILVAKNGPASKISELKIQCTPQPGHSFNVSVEFAGSRLEQKIALQRYLWAEQNYTPLAKALLSTWKIPVPTPSNEDETELFNQLSTADMAVLIRAGKRVSESLTRAPLDGSLHEQAALVVGSLALREAAGTFNDTRPALDRMTAHLTLARAVQPEEGNCGKLARIIQLSLLGRQAEAFTNINSLPASLEQWKRALLIRTTGDWRVLADPVRATRLEKFEYFRALRERGLCPKSRAFLSQIHADPDPEWIRVAMEEDLSVQEGHAFALASVESEIKSAVDDWRTSAGEVLSKSQFIETLNRRATRCVNKELDGKLKYEVLSWGTLAAFHQRHLCHALTKTEHFLQDSWGVPEEAKEFRGNVERSFSRMALFPIARRYFKADDNAEGIGLEAAIATSREHPELLTAATWSTLNQMVDRRQVRALPSDGAAWFGDFPIFGTTYDFGARSYRVRGATDALKLERMLTLAPFNYDIIRAHLHAKHKGRETGEELALAFTAIKDFDLRAMWLVAEGFKSQPETYGKMVEAICALHPDYFLILGQYYIDRKMPTHAALAYQNAFDKAEDRVYVANSTRWIVDYYFDHGRTDDALKIARDAAEVYSHTGLCTMAHLMERMKRYPEAEEYYKKVHERYEDVGVLNAFYVRNHDQKPEYARMSERLKASTFPAGIENAQLKDFNGRPRDGVSIASSNSLVEGAHLKAGDVIVAINNIRVHSEKQYLYIRDMDSDPNMTLIVWNGAYYSERKINLPERRLYCQLADFKAH